MPLSFTSATNCKSLQRLKSLKALNRNHGKSHSQFGLKVT